MPRVSLNPEVKEVKPAPAPKISPPKIERVPVPLPKQKIGDLRSLLKIKDEYERKHQKCEEAENLIRQFQRFKVCESDLNLIVNILSKYL